MKNFTTYLRRRNEQGSASAEMVIVLPVLALIMVGLIGAARLAYDHLALITVANDCVTSAAQVADNTRAGEQGGAAAEASLSTFNVTRPLRGIAAGTTTTTCSASLVVMGPPTNYQISYTFRLPFNPYKSNWEADE